MGSDLIAEQQKMAESEAAAKLKAAQLKAPLRLGKQDLKPKKLPGMIVVKKAKVDAGTEAASDAAVASSSAAAPAATVAAAGIGLGAYGSSSEDEGIDTPLCA